MYIACVPLCPMHKACVVRWPAMHIACADAHILRARCIRPAETMHKYFAVLRHLMGHFAELRNKLLRFLSIMLTFMRFYGRLHAKMTINSSLNYYIIIP